MPEFCPECSPERQAGPDEFVFQETFAGEALPDHAAHWALHSRTDRLAAFRRASAANLAEVFISPNQTRRELV